MSSARGSIGSLSPLNGISEGEARHQMYMKQFRDFAHSQAEGSIADVAMRNHLRTPHMTHDVPNKLMPNYQTL